MTDSIFKKECSICKEVKDIIEFPKDNNKKYGKGSRCKSCLSQLYKQKYQEKKNNREFEIV